VVGNLRLHTTEHANFRYSPKCVLLQTFLGHGQFNHTVSGKQQLVVGMAVKANPREVWEETPAVNNHYKKMNYLGLSARTKGGL
jgi:hypothetical protein